MMKNFTPEMIEKAKVAKSAEELMTLAKENNVELTEDEAKTYFAQLNPASGELSDDELDNVAGGGCGGSSEGNGLYYGQFQNDMHVRTSQYMCYYFSGRDLPDNHPKKCYNTLKGKIKFLTSTTWTVTCDCKTLDGETCGYVLRGEGDPANMAFYPDGEN